MSQTLIKPAPSDITYYTPRRNLERGLVVAFTLIPFLALFVAGFLLWQRGLSGVDLGLLVGFYLFTGFGITVGFHRLFAHRAFTARKWVRIFFAVAGSMAIEGPIIGWVADHRRHHEFSDIPGDPHSPHLQEEEGVKGVVKGLWHAHVGWLFLAEKTVEDRYAPDMLRERPMVVMNRTFAWWVTLSMLLPAAIGFAVTGSLWGALSAFVWGSLVRVFLLHHVTYSINSICHYFGKRPYETKDESRNNWTLALISFGESWHNNHHAFPSSAVHGLGRGQLDPGAYLIAALERLHLVDGVKRPQPKHMQRKRRLGSGRGSRGVARRFSGVRTPGSG